MKTDFFKIPIRISQESITWALSYSSKNYDSICESVDDIPIYHRDDSVSTLTISTIRYALEYKFSYLVHFKKSIAVAEEILKKLNTKLIENKINLNFYFYQNTLYYNAYYADVFSYDIVFDGISSISADNNHFKSDGLATKDLAFNPFTGALEIKNS